jgi:hypothetical protein
MIGICVKAGFTCPDCEGFIPLNAFVERISCPSCGSEHDLTVGSWKTVLDDAISEAPHAEEGEGSSSTVFGDYNYRIEYGRLQPRFSGTKDSISVEEIMGNLDNGFLPHPETGEETALRRTPAAFSKEFPGIVALIGEDSSLIPGKGKGSEVAVENSSSPVALQCPHCGGSLVVSGDRRNETCSFCDTEVHLPDDLWKMLHPARKAVRWYLLVDYGSMPFSWADDLLGCAAADDGALFLVVENDYGDKPIIACVRADRTTLWMRDDLSIRCSPDGETPGPSIDFRGNVLVAHENEMDLLSVSLKDGSITGTITGTVREAGVDHEGYESFCMKDVRGMTALPDGSIILLLPAEDERAYYTEFHRFDLNGNSLPLWSPQEEWKNEEKKPGFLARLFGRFSGTSPISEVPYFDSIGDRPCRLKDSSIDLASGPDGTLYMLEGERLAAFDGEGTMKYSVELPCNSVWGRPVADSDGAAFVLTESEDDRYQVHKVSPLGEVSLYAASVHDGGRVENSDAILLTSDGWVHVLGYGGVWITIDHPESEDGLT